MRLHVCILALCVCLHRVRAASINAPEKKLDDLDNVDLDAETDLEQPGVQDVDNNLRKNIVDIPVKVVQESNLILNENSNDYVPKESDNLVIKRLELDLQNPGPPQRQEHETQNPESYGEKEKAIFAIKQSMDETQDIFNKGLKSVSNSFKTLFAENEDLPAIQQNIQNLRQTFTSQIEKLNTTIRSYLNPNPNLEIVESGLRNLENNFKSGVDTLTEGVEVLSILREEDEAAREEPVSGQGASQSVSEAPASASPAVPAATSPAQNPSQITQPVINFLQGFQQNILNAFSGINNAIQNTLSGGTPASTNQNPVTGPFVNFWNGITGSNVAQGQNTGNQANANGAAAQPAGTQSDAVPAPPAPSPAPWSPGAIFQQVQTSFQNLINPQTNQQQNQPQPASGGPITQALQSIVQFIRPGQNNAQQAQPPAPAATPVKAPEAAVPQASNDVPANPAQTNSAPAVAEPVQAQPLQQSAPSTGPIQQLVQNNPIIKGIQNAVQRIQNPSSDTPRNEEIKENAENNNVETKGHGGGSSNQSDSNISGRVGISPESEGIQEEILVKCEKEIAEKVEEEKIPSISDKTE